MDPFNIELLFLNKNNIKQLIEVKSLDIFEPNTDIFKLDGLFSQEIFGPVGSELRTTQYGYINLKLKILHPLAYRSLIQLKTLYKNIASGKKYASFDEDLNDFVLSNPIEGKTGYDFFYKHIHKLNLTSNDSDSRGYKIELINKYYKKENDNILDKWLVYPAGLRDYTLDKDGRGSYDEVNDIYKKLLATANMLNNTTIDSGNLDMFNTIRFKLQNITLEIYEYFENLLKGKKKFLQNKWTKRAIVHGTRNVITATPIIIDNINSKNKISFNNTVIGIYQYLEAANPIVKNRVLEMFSHRIFNPDTNTAPLVNIKTMKTTLVDISSRSRDDWLSEESLDNTIAKMGQELYRSEPILVEDNYLMLIYDDGKKIELIYNTEEMNESLNKKYLRPITYVELFYLAIYDIKDKYPGLVTRYPITEAGSIYPCVPYVRTTNNSRTVEMKYYGDIKEINEYPILGESYFNSLSVHSTHLEHLGGDHDGDTVSFNLLYTDESIKEIDELLKSKKYYLTPNNELMYRISTDPLELVLKHLTF